MRLYEMRGSIERWLTVALLLATATASADDVTVTTYYPSPRGVYHELRTMDNTYLAVQNSNAGIAERGRCSWPREAWSEILAGSQERFKPLIRQARMPDDRF